MLHAQARLMLKAELMDKRDSLIIPIWTWILQAILILNTLPPTAARAPQPGVLRTTNDSRVFVAVTERPGHD